MELGEDAGFYQGDLPTFRLMGNKNTTALVRDAFTDAEVKALFELPMFTGHMRHSRNKLGPVLRQDHLYWSYVIMNLSGMRPAEIAQLEIDDLRLEPAQQIYYFDLRPSDPAKGRVSREEIKLLHPGEPPPVVGPLEQRPVASRSPTCRLPRARRPAAAWSRSPIAHRRAIPQRT